MRRIIIPTDFSENSFVGIHYAIELFGIKEVKYFLVNSVEPPKGRATVFMSLVERLDKQSQEQLIRVRKQIVEDLDLTDLDMECITVHGDIMSNMEDLVQELEATSIFMGTKGRGNVAEKFIGSNTFRVLKNTQSPIFIIPRNIEIKKPARIGLATDLEEISAELVARIVRFAKSQNAELDIINVRMDGTPADQNKVDVYDEHFKEVEHEFHFVSGNNVAEDLNQVALERKIDLMIMVRHQHNLFDRLFVPSSTREMVLVTKVPLFMLKE